MRQLSLLSSHKSFLTKMTLCFFINIATPLSSLLWPAHANDFSPSSAETTASVDCVAALSESKLTSTQPDLDEKPKPQPRTEAETKRIEYLLERTISLDFMKTAEKNKLRELIRYKNEGFFDYVLEKELERANKSGDLSTARLLDEVKSLVRTGMAPIKTSIKIDIQTLRRHKAEYTNSGQHNNFGKNFLAVEDHVLRTLQVTLKDDYNIVHGDAIIPLFHGSGTSSSHSDAMLNIMRHLSSSSPGKKGSTLEELRQYKNYFPVWAVAIDMPGHGVGTITDDFSTPALSAEYIARFIQELRRQVRDRRIEYNKKVPKDRQVDLYPKVLPLTRSSTAMYPLIAAKARPGLIDSTSWMSPTMTGDPKVLADGLTELRRLAEELGDFAIADEGLTLIEDHLHQNPTWTPEDMTLIPQNTHLDLSHDLVAKLNKDFKIYISTGSLDEQVVEIERSLYRQLAEASPNVTYRDFLGQRHDVFDVSNHHRAGRTNRESGMAAYKAFYDWAHHVVYGYSR